MWRDPDRRTFSHPPLAWDRSQSTTNPAVLSFTDLAAAAYRCPNRQKSAVIGGRQADAEGRRSCRKY
jgi:hypothetical protein